MTKVIPNANLTNGFELIGHFKGQDGINTWRNSIAIFDTSAVPAPSDPIVSAMETFWKHNLITSCHYDHSELRHWTRGDVPFSAEGAIWNSSLGAGAGTKTAAGAYSAEGTAGVGKEVVAFIRIATSPGKEGKMYLRGLLDNQDVFSQAGGQWIFITPGPPNVTPAKFSALVTTDLGAFLGAVNPRLCVVHFSVKNWNASAGAPANAPFETPITSMTMVGPTVNKATRRSSR